LKGIIVWQEGFFGSWKSRRAGHDWKLVALRTSGERMPGAFRNSLGKLGLAQKMISSLALSQMQRLTDQRLIAGL
jgi:hypothetical protein